MKVVILPYELKDAEILYTKYSHTIIVMDKPESEEFNKTISILPLYNGIELFKKDNK